MRRLVGVVFALFVLLASRTAFSSQNEIDALENLIVCTEKRLEAAKQLKELMIAFKNQREEFSLKSNSRTLASRLISSAHLILNLIEQEHLQHLFSAQYLEEITFFSSIAGRHALKRP